MFRPQIAEDDTIWQICFLYSLKNNKKIASIELGAFWSDCDTSFVDYEIQDTNWSASHEALVSMFLLLWFSNKLLRGYFVLKHQR